MLRRLIQLLCTKKIHYSEYKQLVEVVVHCDDLQQIVVIPNKLC